MGQKDREVGVDVKDLYQFLISDCRYGYTRNNHLMPWGAFHHAYDYLPKMRETNPDFAESTAKQLAEECIEQLRMYTFSEDRMKAILIIKKDGKEIDRAVATWTPGANLFSVDKKIFAEPGLELFVSSVKGEDEPRMFLSMAPDGDGVRLSKIDYSLGYTTRVYVPCPEKGEGWYSSLLINDGGLVVESGKELLLIVERNSQLNVSDYYEFIDYCVALAKELGSRGPYNEDDYEEFLKAHPKKGDISRE